jgi:hypothetical protein
MSLKTEHKFRFDAAGKLDADEWLLIPRAQLREEFVLDGALADKMARHYFEIVEQASRPMVRIVSDAQGVRYLSPLGKTAMIFADPEQIVDAQRVETSWRIAGGFMLAHNVNYGGRFYLGAEWQTPEELKLYTTIRRYPPRLTNWFGINGGVAVYQRTQRVFHERIGTRFLNDIAASIRRDG